MFAATYRLSFYLMLVLATLVMSIDVTDQNPIAMIYPLAVLVAGLVAFFTVDRNPKIGLDRGTANLIALASMSLIYLEYRYDENLLLLALAHWLVSLQIVKMFLPKTIEDDWFLFINAVVQVLVGGFMSQSDLVGTALFAWAVTSLWVLWLFALHREALRSKVAEGTTRSPEIDPREPYPSLIDPAFLFAAFRVALTTLALGGVIFLVMPRRQAVTTTGSGDMTGKHLTGFDEDVKLGQLGEILESDSVVFTASLTEKQSGARFITHDELLWRGVSLSGYSRARWRKPGSKQSRFPTGQNGRPVAARIVLQEIRLEPTDNKVLFGLAPLISARPAQGSRLYSDQINYDGYDGSIERSNPATGTYDYVVESDARLDTAFAHFDHPEAAQIHQLSHVDDLAFAKRLLDIAGPVVKDIHPDDHLAIALRLESFLRDSGQFHYTLIMDVVDPRIDPVIDFLVNRKEGHCEYFASALALMLRSLKVPCRLVNGFKGGDWNELSGTWVVRQKHAHSWVEVYAPPSSNLEGPSSWFTLDPTPGTERDASVAKVSGFAGNFRQFSDFARYAWTFYVVGFNAERQQRFIYAPAKELWRQARLGYDLLWAMGSDAIAWVFNFPNLAAFVSVRGFLVSFGLLTMLAGVIRVCYWLGRRFLRRLRGNSQDALHASGTLFYRRLVDLLKMIGQDRTPSETPREFARRASIFLSSLENGAESVADVPPQVVEAFYLIRFGGRVLNPEDLSHLESRLDALEGRLRPSSS